MKNFERITIEAGKMGGRACIRGLRITVSQVVKMVANGMTVKSILKEYPDLQEEDVQQALHYAAATAGEEVHNLTGS